MQNKNLKNRIQKRKRHISWGKLLALSIIFLIFIFGVYKLAAIGISYYKGENNSNKTLSEKEIISKISTHMIMPKEEISMMIKVKDSEVLRKESAFYKDVQKGDYLVVYPSLAVIYNQKEDKVVRSMDLRP
jgi:hypothetical protein